MSAPAIGLFFFLVSARDTLTLVRIDETQT